MISNRIRDKEVRGEPITMEYFVSDIILKKTNLVPRTFSLAREKALGTRLKRDSYRKDYELSPLRSVSPLSVFCQF